MNRRQFMKLTSALGLVQFYPLASFSQTAKPTMGADKDIKKFFVLLQGSGGMDVTLGLDPKSHTKSTDQKDIFIEYRPEDIFAKGNIKLGPAAMPLKSYADDLAIINGVVMRSDVGHQSLINYMSTGDGANNLASLPVEFNIQFNKTIFGVLADTSELLMGQRTSKTTQVSDLISQNGQNAEVNDFLNLHLQSSRYENKVQKDLLAFAEIKKAIIEKAMQLQNQYEATETQSVIAACFLAGQALSAQLDIGSEQGNNENLDTHNSHEGVHLTNQTNVWQTVSDFFKLFKSLPYGGSTLFDHTTFMVVSEFSRTPFLNADLGKDHNVFTNSVLLSGYGIKGGQTIGASHVIPRGQSPLGYAQHFGSPVDYKTGQVVMSNQGTGLIFPENVIKSVAKAIGGTTLNLYPELSDIKTLNQLVK